MQKEVRVKSLHDLPAVVTEVLDLLKVHDDHASVLALSGDLGAGKTTFVQHLARTLGVADTVTSPTFTVLQRYECEHEKFQTLLHMDAYRIDDHSELGPLHFTELLQSPQTLFCIEWAEKIKDVLPSGVVFLDFEIGEGEERLLRFTTT